MWVLGIETSGELAGLAVADEQGVAAELAFRHRNELSRTLAGRVEAVLALAGIEVGDLGGIAVTVGPGSFTGLRLGVTFAKSLALARQLPVVGIGALEALAAERPAHPDALICAVMSASDKDLYAALFQWRGGRPEPRAEEMLLPVQDLAQRLARAPLHVILAGQPGPHRALLCEALGDRLSVLPYDVPPRAATVALLGHMRIAEGAVSDLHALGPRYLRPSAAEARREAACQGS
ncbi:MAG: tRNA (adenosine(37)-N6)-threonylcarbamoyltransferase complex dimerization subunit type 1 TsaB [Armatimonadota bacterium]